MSTNVSIHCMKCNHRGEAVVVDAAACCANCGKAASLREILLAVGIEEVEEVEEEEELKELSEKRRNALEHIFWEAADNLVNNALADGNLEEEMFSHFSLHPDLFDIDDYEDEDGDKVFPEEEQNFIDSLDYQLYQIIREKATAARKRARNG